MKHKTLFSLIAVLCVFSLASAAFAGGGKDEGSGKFAGNYPMGGSTTVEPIAVSAIEAFSKQYPDSKLSYDSQGSSVGVTGVIDGVYVLGGSSRELKDKEIEAGAVANAIALDGIAVIANQSVPVDNLSLEQVAKIFSGEIKNWKQVGGQDKPIVVVNRDEASGTRAAFTELVLHPVMGKEQGKFIADAITVESNGDMVTKVGQTPDTIGYCGFGYVDRAKNMGGKVVSVNGKDPEISNVLSGSYPISRKLYMVSKGQLKDESLEKTFVDFILSKEGQQIVEDAGFIALP
jgi:phosphate transport system substrate-binding protein